MLLPVVTEAITHAPKYIAGISFSDRSIRFVEVERHKDNLLTLSSYGQITIPYDVMESGKVINMVEFTEVMRKLNSSLNSNARVIIRKDDDHHKVDALAFAGYTDIYLKEGIDALRGIFIPWHTDAQRICLFANYDTTYVLRVTGYDTELLGKISKEELFSPGIGDVLRSYLEEATDPRILMAGKYEDESYVEQLALYGLVTEETTIWKNLFDFSRYIPEIPQDESYQYTVPAGLVVAGLMGDSEKISVSTPTRYVSHKSNKSNKEKGKTDTVISKETTKRKERRASQDQGGLADFLVDVQPLTKLAEDKRKQSEKKLSRKYTKLL